MQALLRRFRPHKKADAWSPYGHEAMRRELLVLRRVQIILVAIFLAVGYSVFVALTLTEDTTPRRSGIDVELDTEQKPITVSVTPGGVPAFATQAAEEPDPLDPPGPVYRRSETVQRLEPFLLILGPLMIAFAVLSRVGASAQGKLAELNFGVYKGAMPYELHAAKARASVFTHRLVDGNVFGKQREDFVFGTYLTPPPASVQRYLGGSRAEPAQITRLRRSGYAKARLRAAGPGTGKQTA